MTKITSDEATFSALTLHNRYLDRHTMLEETRCVTTQVTVAETVCLVPRAGKMNISCPVIGCPSGQNAVIVSARDYPHYPAKRDCFLGPYIKYHKGFKLVFICQAC